MDDANPRMTNDKPSTTLRAILLAFISPAASCISTAWHGRMGHSTISPIRAMGCYHMADDAPPSTDTHAARSC